MMCIVSQNKVFKILEWILFIGFIITSGCFASGVLQQFFSRKTSFSQHKEKVKDLFDRSHNLSHYTLYPDVLKIKTIIIEKQNFAKMPFVYY